MKRECASGVVQEISQGQTAKSQIAREAWGCPAVCYYEAKEMGCTDEDMYGGDEDASG